MAKTNPTTDNYERIMNELRAKKYKPIYMLMGAEPYFIDAITNYIAQNVLTLDEQAFNLTVLYGENSSAREIDVAARRFPMMAERQVIIVKEAQQIKKIEDLARYAAKPLSSTILVLCFKSKIPDKRSAFYKALAKTSEMFESEPFKSYDTDIIFNWIIKYLQTKKCAIERPAAALLVEALGTDVAKIVSELDRLMMMLPAGTKKITPKQVEYLGVSKDFNSFELCSALMRKDKKKVQQIINYFEKNPKNFDLQPTLGVLFSQFTKLFGYQMLRIKYKGFEIPSADLQAVVGVHPFIIEKEYAPAAQKFTSSKTAQILSAIRHCDVRSKGWGGVQRPDGELLKELSFIITH
jgi:DNA polymerase-3 subunit delta